MKNPLKKKLLVLLTVLFICSLGLFAACSGGENQVGEWIVREPNEAATGETYTQESFLPKASAPEKVIQYIDLRESGNVNIFLGVALQGIVNKQSPRIWVLSDSMVEGEENTAYWFEKLDELYPSVYTKQEYTDIYQLIADNQDRIDGYILYHERLCDSKMRSRNYYRALYGDMACLDLTIMLASKYNAVPLTANQYATLKNKYGVTLEMKGDTTWFMEKDADGNILNTDAARASRETWKKVFIYTLTRLKDDLNTQVFAHNAAFTIASADYWIQQNMLVYSRILDSDATQEERDIESALLALTEENAASVGVWYLQNDEGGYVARLTQAQKTMVVTYETFNLSWTSGLETVYPEKTEQRDLEPEAGKIYLSFDLSEGDNISYSSFRLNDIMDAPAAAGIMGWTFAPTLGEIAPNMMKYFNTKLGPDYSVVLPEQGVAYVSMTPTQQSFYEATAAYLDRLGSDSIRILGTSTVDCLAYADRVDGLNAVLVGYMGEGGAYWNNNEEANILYNDTVFFRHYDGRSLTDLGKYNAAAPAFFSISLYGWGQSADSIEAVMKNLDDRFVVVTPSELASLYKKYISTQFTDVVSVDFDADMSQNEMGFLTYASDHSQVSVSDGRRYADGADYMVYKFDLDDEVQTAELFLEICGRYQVECSVDNRNWQVLAKADHYVNQPQNLKLSLDPFLEEAEGNVVYVRIGDATPGDASGAVLSHVMISTDRMETNHLTLTAQNDLPYLIQDASQVTADGRTGSFTYRIAMAPGIETLTLSTLTEGDMAVEISTDDQTYTPLNFAGKAGKASYADLSDLLREQGTVFYLRFSGTGELQKLKLTPSQPIVEESFSPSGNSLENSYAISFDGEVANPSAINSFRRLEKTDELLYRFVLDERVTSLRLDLNILGTYKVGISSDGKNFTDVVVAQTGGVSQNQYVYTDITDFLSGGGDIFVRIGLIDSTKDTVVRVFGIRLITDLSSDSMLQRYEAERLPDLSLQPAWNGQYAEGDPNYGQEDPSSTEYALIDRALTTGTNIYLHNGVQPLRGLSENDSCFVYKFDFSADNISFWQTLVPNFPQTPLTDLKIDVDIAEGYVIEVSTDGQTWTEVAVASVDDSYRGGASNRTVERILLGEQIAQSEIVYLRISDNTPQNGWGALVFGLDFYFN